MQVHITLCLGQSEMISEFTGLSRKAVKTTLEKENGLNKDLFTRFQCFVFVTINISRKL